MILIVGGGRRPTAAVRSGAVHKREHTDSGRAAGPGLVGALSTRHLKGARGPVEGAGLGGADAGDGRQTISLSDLSGNALTTLRAGLAG